MKKLIIVIALLLMAGAAWGEDCQRIKIGDKVRYTKEAFDIGLGIGSIARKGVLGTVFKIVERKDARRLIFYRGSDCKEDASSEYWLEVAQPKQKPCRWERKAVDMWSGTPIGTRDFVSRADAINRVLSDNEEWEVESQWWEPKERTWEQMHYGIKGVLILRRRVCE